MNEQELLAALDAHDALVVRCARDEMDYAEFEKVYDNFFQRWALDGHESSLDEKEVLRRHANRIHVHRRVWEEVICHSTSDDLAYNLSAQQSGFIGSAEAQRRLMSIARDAGLLAE